jgi:tRNA/rRNA methyltransferase
MPMSLANVRIVLVRPRGAANIGAVARAMKNMGLCDLVLVQPVSTNAFWTRAMAVHAGDVLRRVRRAGSLPAAVADCGLVVGTTCRDGLYRATAEPPRIAAPGIVAAAASNPVALVFGPEDHGLSNDDLKACHGLIAIPTAPEYPSLNLAHAVMVCCYELFLAGAGNCESVPQLAPAGDVDFMFHRLQTAFLSIGFLHADNPDHIMFAFRRMLGRARMEERDMRILLALARQIEWFGRGGWKVAAGKRQEDLVETARSPGNESPGSAAPRRLKPTKHTELESPSGDFSETQPGNSFPGD